MVKAKTDPTNSDSEPLKVQNQRFKELGSLIESLRHRVQLLDIKAAVLGGAYVNLIFQALLYGHLTAAATRSFWLLLCLSLSVSIAFWPAVIATINDTMSTRFQQESCFVEQDRVYRKICSVRRSGGGGGGLDGMAFAPERRRRHAYVRVLYLAMLVWTVSVPCLFLFVPNERVTPPQRSMIYSGSLSI